MRRQTRLWTVGIAATATLFTAGCGTQQQAGLTVQAAGESQTPSADPATDAPGREPPPAEKAPAPEDAPHYVPTVVPDSFKITENGHPDEASSPEGITTAWRVFLSSADQDASISVNTYWWPKDAGPIPGTPVGTEKVRGRDAQVQKTGNDHRDGLVLLRWREGPNVAVSVVGRNVPQRQLVEVARSLEDDA